MTETRQLQDDLHYVRHIVTQRDRQLPPGTAAIYYVWAAYTLIGYTLIDLAPRYSGPFFAIGGFAAGILSAFIGYRASRRSGEYDSHTNRAAGLHWGGGVILSIAATIALTAVIPPLREKTYAGQLTVVMIGIVYYLAGIHFDRTFLWLGPILILGGICVAFIPHYGWTLLGLIIAAGLVIPTLIPPRRGEQV
jgi:peptidoglycan/LPS O-acetylase OafA/YrhL